MVYDLTQGHKITGNYGESRPYYTNGHTHQGLDIAYGENTPIPSAISGKVKKIGYDKNGYGNYIDIYDAGSGITTRYAHANRFSVKVGDLVKEGQHIGLVGQTGRATGPHIHFEVYQNNQRKNPKELKNIMATKFLPKTTEVPDISNAELAKIYAVNDALKQEEAKQQAQAGATTEEKKEVAPYLTPKEQETRDTILDLVNGLFKPIEEPKEVTLQDVFNSKGGGLDETLGQWITSPQGRRLMGAIGGAYSYNPQTKMMENTAEPMARKEEAQLQAEKEKAQEQRKIQSQLAGNMYGSMANIAAEREKGVLEANKLLAELQIADLKNQREDAKEAKADKQQDFNNNVTLQKLELEKQKVENDKAEKDKKNKADTIVIDGHNYVMPNLSSKDRATIATNNQGLAMVDKIESIVKANPNAYGMKGLLPNMVQNKTFKNGIAARSMVNQLTAEYRKIITGAQMSDAERKAFYKFLPSEYDDANAILSKMNSMRQILNSKNQGVMNGYVYEDLGTVQRPNATPRTNQISNVSEMKSKLKKAGYSDSQINQYLKKKGLI